jgi:hypothetical protein
MTTRDLTPASPPNGLDLFGDPPGWFLGSKPEWVVYNCLIEQHLEPGEDFDHQSAILGGRVDLGGLVLDFVFANPAGLAINVQGVYYHYEKGAGEIQRSVLARELFAAQGGTLIFIDDDALAQNPRFLVREALAFRDRSRLGTGGF